MLQKYPIKIFAYGECEISAFGRCDMSGFVRRDINLLRKFVKYPASQDVIVTEPKNESNVGVYRTPPGGRFCRWSPIVINKKRAADAAREDLETGITTIIIRKKITTPRADHDPFTIYFLFIWNMSFSGNDNSPFFI